MRYAVISDMHGNLEAFRAVLSALSEERIDQYLFIGDVVGYGADPKECVKLLRSLNPVAAVAGNHEWGVLEKIDISYFNKDAQGSIIWTRSTLNKDESEYLGSFPLTYEDEKIALVHGTLNDPEEFYYIFDTEDAYVTLSQMKTPLCFVGHSHVPGIFFTTDGKVEYVESSEVRIDIEQKYVINVGSVGQPRDGDPRASFAIYDDETYKVEIRRVEYDIKKAQEKILRAGLPPESAHRLAEGR